MWLEDRWLYKNSVHDSLSCSSAEIKGFNRVHSLSGIWDILNSLQVLHRDKGNVCIFLFNHVTAGLIHHSAQQIVTSNTLTGR
jgi:hypothetical protein